MQRRSLLLLAIALAGCRVPPPSAPLPRVVPRLQTSAELIVQDESVVVFRVDDPSRRRTVVKRSGNNNSALAVTPDQKKFFFSDERVLFMVAGSAAPVAVFSLDRMPELDKNASINWMMMCGASRIIITVLGGAPLQNHLVEIDLGDGSHRALAVPFPASVAADLERRRAFVPRGNARVIAELDFAANSVRELPTGSDWQGIDLSASRDRLLLSSHPLLARTPITIRDVASGAETSTGVVGYMAEWLTDTSFLFVVDENELWLHDLSRARSRQLFDGGERTKRTDRGSYAQAPVLSASRLLIAFAYEMSLDGKQQLKTALLDLRNDECVILDDWWHNFTWREPAA